jgi:peroxiredoxin
VRAAFVFAAGVVLFLAVVVLLPHPPPQLLATGSAAPQLQLGDTHGRTHDVVTESRGHGAVIVFFETTCPTCQAEAGHICTVAHDHPSLHVVLVDAGLEDSSAIDGFASHRMAGCDVTFLLDPGDVGTHSWGVSVVPTVYVLTTSGHIGFGGVGEAGFSGLDAAVAHG